MLMLMSRFAAQTEGDTGYDYNDIYDEDYEEESGTYGYSFVSKTVLLLTTELHTYVLRDQPRGTILNAEFLRVVFNYLCIYSPLFEDTEVNENGLKNPFKSLLQRDVNKCIYNHGRVSICFYVYSVSQSNSVE